MSTLMDYVRATRESGFSQENITKKLVDSGWSESEILATIHKVEQERYIGRYASKTKQTLKTFGLPVIFLALIAAFFLIPSGSEPTGLAVEPVMKVYRQDSVERDESTAQIGEAKVTSASNVAIGEQKVAVVEEIERSPVAKVKESEPVRNVNVELKQSVHIESASPSVGSECQGMVGGSERDDCFALAAKKEPRAMFCDQIRSADFRDSCLRDVAIAKKQSVICYSAKNRNDCLLYYANIMKDLSACNTILDKTIRSQCGTQGFI